MTLRILTIVGARPQFIKAAPLSRALTAYGIEEVMVHTGQHSDANMSEIFFNELDIAPPAHNLNIRGGDNIAMIDRMRETLAPLIANTRPDAVVVYGDTNSTVAGASAAKEVALPVVHVEAGLRSFDNGMQEEINRVTVDRIAAILLCPTHLAVRNLAAEGITDGVHHVGDVMYDAALEAGQRSSRQSRIVEELRLTPRQYCVATVHRAENVDDGSRLSSVVDWLDQYQSHMPIVMPLHPRTRLAIERDKLAPKRVRLIDPLGYIDMTELVRNAAEVLTDSGGLQKEAYFHRVPCVTLRDTTEWTETINAGWNRLWHGPGYATPRRTIDDYGDGHAAERAAEILIKTFG